MLELSGLRSIIKLLRGDPLLGDIHRIRDDVARLIRGYFLDGLSALEDAANTTDAERQRHFIEVAREYFRQATNREAGASSSRASEYMALCSEALGRTDDATRGLQSTYSRIQRLHAEYIKPYYAAKTITPRNALIGMRMLLALDERQRFLHSAALKGTRVLSAADVPGTTEQMTKYEIFLLEQQARRLQIELAQRSVVTEPLTYLFANDDIELLIVMVGRIKGWYTYTRTTDGRVRRWSNHLRDQNRDRLPLYLDV
jgi:hypothetical protein